MERLSAFGELGLVAYRLLDCGFAMKSLRYALILLLANALILSAVPSHYCAALLSANALAPAAKIASVSPPSNLPTIGHLRALAIFARFADEQPLPVPPWAHQLFTPSRSGSFSHFYRLMSFGRLEVEGLVLPRRYAVGTASAYLASRQGAGGRYGDFVQEILTRVDADIDFAQFDNDGPDGVANSGDDDGWVDYLFINVQSVPTGFLLGTATGVVGLGFDEFATGDMGLSGELIRISGAPERGSIGGEGNFSQTVGTMAHEFGHSLGLDDYFDRSFLFDPEQANAEDSAGIGRWGLMGWGALGWDGAGGPTPLSARSLEKLGWISVENGRLVEVIGDMSGLPALDPFAGGRVYKIPLRAESVDNVTLHEEYLLLEYRDREAHYYNRGQPASGLLVWHVRSRVGDNDREQQKHVDLLCADGLYGDAGFPLGSERAPFSGRDNLDFWAHDESYSRVYGGNLGDATDPFDGVRYQHLNLETNPSTLASSVLSEATTGLGLSMRRDGDTMQIDVRWPRWAGTLRTEAHWAGLVLIDGDLTISPQGRLVVFRNTQVLIASGDRLAQGVDVKRSEIRVLGDMIIREAPISQVFNIPSRTVLDTTLFAAQEKGQTWSGIIVTPQQDSELVFPQGSYEVRDAELGLVVDGPPPVGESLDIRGFIAARERDELGRALFAPGQVLRLGLDINNRSPLAFFTGVRAFLEWDDPSLSPPRGSGRTRTVSFPSGEKQLFFFGARLVLREDAIPGAQIDFVLRIEKNGIPLWSGPFSIAVAGEATAVASGAILPADFALLPNYPNPFNASTVIPYELPRAARVRLAIYNALGQLEQVLVDQMQMAGAHQVIWDAPDMANGAYSYELSVGSYRETRRLLLLR